MTQLPVSISCFQERLKEMFRTEHEKLDAEIQATKELLDKLSKDSPAPADPKPQSPDN